MKTLNTAILCALTLGLASQASAASKTLTGSDTLHQVINYIIELKTPGAHPESAFDGTDCGDVIYPIASSGAGENALCANTQEIAPMSRALGKSKVCFDAAHGGSDTCYAQSNNGTTALDYQVGWDALSVSRPASSFVSCDDLGPKNADAAGGHGWEYKLGVIYAGSNYTSNDAATGAGTLASCDTAERRALVADWSEILNGCTAEDSAARCAAGLRHALRRNDGSGTTSVFKELTGIKAPSGTSGFCNGTETQDNDPVRIKCRVDVIPGEINNQNERYCPKTHIGGNAAYNGTLGVVLPMTYPTVAAADLGAVLNNNACSPGKFAFIAQGAGNCLNGAPKLAGSLCAWPYYEPSPGVREFGCNNSRTNLPAGSAAGTDGRVYNEQHRRINGTRVFPLPGAEPVYKFYRTTVGCNQESATDQIGCIVGGQKCFIGFGGREQLNNNPTTTKGVKLAGVAPVGPTADADVRAGNYGLARKLFVNTLSGFGAITDVEEGKLNTCIQNLGLMNEVLEHHGFIGVDSQVGTNPCL
jgi:hypothetical protein